MKSGFFLSGTAHSLLITFLFTNGLFSMPDRKLENLEKLDIMILSEAEFDAISSSPPIIENLSSPNYKKLKTPSQDLKLQNNEIEKLEEQMQALHEEESKYQAESGEDVNQHKKLLNDLSLKNLNVTIIPDDILTEKYFTGDQELIINFLNNNYHAH